VTSSRPCHTSCARPTRRAPWTELRLRQLQRALEKEETRERARASADSSLKQRANSLLAEARRIGLVLELRPMARRDELLALLRGLSSTELEANAYPSEGELGALHARRRETLGLLATAQRKSQATRTAIREASGFEGAVTVNARSWHSLNTYI